MTTYSHRNGEETPPEIDGEYWFDGERLLFDENSTNYSTRRIRVSGTVEHDIPGSGYFTFLYTYQPEPEPGRTNWSFEDKPDDYELRGRWWGPIVPPWESAE